MSDDLEVASVQGMNACSFLEAATGDPHAVASAGSGDWLQQSPDFVRQQGRFICSFSGMPAVFPSPLDLGLQQHTHSLHCFRYNYEYLGNVIDKRQTNNLNVRTPTRG
jgi:hypothetical protein